MTAVMLVLIWLPGGFMHDTQTQVIGTPALYFQSMEVCEDAKGAIEAQVRDLNGGAQVSARCYEEAEDPRG